MNLEYGKYHITISEGIKQHMQQHLFEVNYTGFQIK